MSCRFPESEHKPPRLDAIFFSFLLRQGQSHVTGVTGASMSDPISRNGTRSPLSHLHISYPNPRPTCDAVSTAAPPWDPSRPEQHLYAQTSINILSKADLVTECPWECELASEYRRTVAPVKSEAGTSGSAAQDPLNRSQNSTRWHASKHKHTRD